MTKVKISDIYRGVHVGDENYNRIKNIFDEADMQVFLHQGLNKSRMGRVMAAAQAIEEGYNSRKGRVITPAQDGASFPKWLEIYMANVPDNGPNGEIKTEILKEAQKLDEDLVSRGQPVHSTASDVGGIDLTRDKMGLQVQGEGQGVQFKFDPTMIQQLQNSSGLTPVIIDIHSMTTTIPVFLGLADNQSSQQVASL